MLLIYGTPNTARAEAESGALEKWLALTAEMGEVGVLVAGDQLHPAESATTVRDRDGQRLVSDGPFAETKEHLLGYYILDVADLDAALGWAGRLPNVSWGSVEVRPLHRDRRARGLAG